MTSTPVRDISAVLTQFSSGKTAKADAGAGISFKDVWQNQTSERGNETDSAPKTVKQDQRTPDVGDEAPERGDSLKARVPQADSKTETVTEPVESQTPDGELLNVEGLSEVMEVLGTAALQFGQTAARELGLTQEEFASLLNDLGMDQMDLLVPENLTKLVMAAGKTEDSMSFLMNEDLYQSLQNLNTQLKDVMSQVSSETGVPREILEGLLKNYDMAVAGKETEVPVIMVQTPEQAVDQTAAQETEPRIQNTDEEQPVTGKEHQKSVAPADTERVMAEHTQENKTGADASGHHEKSSADSGRQESFLQNLTQRLEQPVTGQTVENGAAVYPDSQPEAIMKQIMDYMKLQLKPDMSSLEMQLHPESLGTLHVQLTSRQGAVTAQFITQNEAVKTALESQMIQLKENFNEQGIRVEQIEVTVQTHEFERNLDQGNGRQQESSGRRNRNRRLNLNFPEDMGEISAEEKMAADLMAASGSTVDYTA